MRIVLNLVLLLIILNGCKQPQIVKPADYEWVLQPGFIDKKVKERQAELDFWNQRLSRDTASYVDMLEVGSNYLSLFKLKGRFADLKAGEHWIQSASQQLGSSDPDILQTLSQVSITNHRFAEAKAFIDEAKKKGGSPFVHELLAFDAGMELGNYKEAKRSLNRLKDQQAFNILIRKAKYEDHAGRSEEAIHLMEQAFQKLKTSNNMQLYCWTLSNLGDMYSHSGRAKEAYHAYIQVLQKDPSYIYALKGIAWIAFAHDGNAEEAKRILRFMLSQVNQPELYLTLAQIAEYEQDTAEKNKCIQHFLQLVQPGGDMYNKYLIELYTSELKQQDKALALAEKEIKSRPTPETFSWLAWVYYHKGDHAKAKTIYKTYVAGHTFEPDALYKGAFILSASGDHDKANELFEKCKESSFELGPVKTRKVKAVSRT